MEWAGVFVVLGTPIPFVVGPIAILKMDTVGVLLASGLTGRWVAVSVGPISPLFS